MSLALVSSHLIWLTGFARSCGFDASEYESPAMNRHGCKVPTSFYHRFTRDACAFAEKHSSGRIVSVMEGGYDDRAVTSGAMAHVSGLVDSMEHPLVDPQWWSLSNLQQVREVTSRRNSILIFACSSKHKQRSVRGASLISCTWNSGCSGRSILLR